jgi:large subunit ribosomal protein L6
MSRIGKMPIALSDKVEVKISDANFVEVKGPKGSLSYQLSNKLKISKTKDTVTITGGSSRELSSLWGLSRTILFNMVHGVSQGFIKSLEFNGVGYKAAVTGSTLTLNLGFSHPIEYKLPKGIEAKVLKNVIEIHGCDKELVGFVSAKVRGFRPPEPYKGKGLKYVDEKIIRKAGKTGAKK